VEFLRIILLPFALVYWVITTLRNLLFDLQILQSEDFKIPLIVVGNLSVGGTGKTPHVEYLIRLLQPQLTVATLSRGYGRETKGFRLATVTDGTSEIGDEPMQYFRKFPKIIVGVDESRRNGIHQMLKLEPVPGVIILDDAFQHRWVKPGYSLLLTDYQHLYSNDYLLPAGRLREPRKCARRANMIIVTKSPKVLSPFVRRDIISRLKPRADQQVLFSYIRYGEWIHFGSLSDHSLPPRRVNTILLVTGIANPSPLEEHLQQSCEELVTMTFSDHHCYEEKDMENISITFENIISRNKLIITTEKDAMRLLNPCCKAWIDKMPWYYIPMEVEFHGQDKELFTNIIFSYATKNSGNSSLYQGKD
jgi:tetraacyldisaccharide 4'-kinase